MILAMSVETSKTDVLVFIDIIMINVFDVKLADNFQHQSEFVDTDSFLLLKTPFMSSDKQYW